MFNLIRCYYKPLCILSVLTAVVIMMGCGSSSSSSAFSVARNQYVITGNVLLQDDLSLNGCRVWIEGNYNNGINTDAAGNFNLVSSQGIHRVIALMKNGEETYIGRSSLISVPGQNGQSIISDLKIEKGTKSFSFKLKDSKGNYLTSQNVMVSLWDIPIEYNTKRNCFITPMMPENLRPAYSEKDDSALGIKITGGGFRDAFMPADVNAGPSVFEYTLSRQGDVSLAPEILSVRTSDKGKTVDTDFINNGLKELRLRVNFVNNGGDIASWTWNDGGIGRFLGINGNRSNTFSDILWEPLSKNSVGTLTFTLWGRSGLSSSVDISINEKLMENGSLAPDPSGPQNTVSPIKLSFSELNEVKNGVVFNPEILYENQEDKFFKIKIKFQGISHISLLKNGTFSDAFHVYGAELISDDTLGNSFSERIYTLKRPSSEGIHTITAVITDNQNRESKASYTLKVQGAQSSGLSLEEISVEPEGTMHNKTESIVFTALAFESSPSNNLNFNWYIGNSLVFKETNNTKQNKKYSIFYWSKNSSVPLNESLPDGTYEIKCVADNGTFTDEKTLAIVISEPINIEFVPQKPGETYNPSYIYANDRAFITFKASIKNRKEADIEECIWEISRNNNKFVPVTKYEVPNSAEHSGETQDSGTGCLCECFVPKSDTAIPGTYTIKLTVKDKKGRMDSAFSGEFYSDAKPEMDLITVEQKFKGKKSDPYYEWNLKCDVNGASAKCDLEMGEYTGYDFSLLVKTAVRDQDPEDPIEFHWEVFAYFYNEDNYLKIYEENRVINNGKIQKDYAFLIPWGVLNRDDECFIRCRIKDKLYGKFETTQEYILRVGTEFHEIKIDGETVFSNWD